MVALLALGGFDGETLSTSREAMIREDSGERSVALVALGSARRVTLALRGFGVVTAGSAMAPTALGVGVRGGRDVMRFLIGVVGASGEAGVADGAGLRLRPMLDVGGGGIAALLCSAVSDASFWLPSLDDLLVAAMATVVVVLEVTRCPRRERAVVVKLDERAACTNRGSMR